MNSEWWMSVRLGSVAICSDMRQREWRSSRFIELQAHHSVQLTYCIRSTDPWMDVCVEGTLLYKTPPRPLLLTSLKLKMIIISNMVISWVHRRTPICTPKLIQNQFTAVSVLIENLSVSHCHTVNFLRLGRLRLLAHMCPLTASLRLYYVPCHSLLTPR